MKNNNKNAYITLEEKIQMEKIKLIEIIEVYFNNLLTKGTEEINKIENIIEEDLNKILVEIEEKKFNLLNLFNEFNSEKVLKFIIQYYNNNYINEFNNFHNKIFEFVENLESKFVIPIVNYNKLNLFKEELPYFIFFPNEKSFFPYYLKPSNKIESYLITNKNFGIFLIKIKFKSFLL